LVTGTTSEHLTHRDYNFKPKHLVLWEKLEDVTIELTHTESARARFLIFRSTSESAAR
jgi:hypothetical protein